MARFDTLRRYWREAEFWRWFWYNRVPVEAKIAGGLALLLLTLGLGWVAAEQLSPASASVVQLYSVRTEHHIVTVRESGKIVRTRVPVIKRVLVPGGVSTTTQTAVKTVTETVTRTVTKPVTTPGRVETIRQSVTTTVPTVKWRSVTLVQTVVQTVTQIQTVTVTAPAP